MSDPGHPMSPAVVGGLAEPATTAPALDPGADTKSRFRYQACYAAWLTIGSLTDLPDVVAVYCEHHDDVLIERADGQCDAVQVKTQDDGVPPLRGTSKPVLGALKRFIELEHVFGHKMDRYMLVSIVGFHGTGTSASNLPDCLKRTATCDDPTAPPEPLKSLIAKLKVPKTIPPAVVLAALRKVVLDASLPKLGDIELRVRRALEELPECREHRPGVLHQVAEAVIALADRAGEVTERTAASAYRAYMEDPAGHAERAVIDAKRLTPASVRATVVKTASTPTLRSVEGPDGFRLPDSAGIAHRKMDAGGLPMMMVNTLDDLRASAEDEIERRLYRDGPAAAKADYDHAKVLVSALAVDARLATARADQPYGRDMYAELRKRIEARLGVDPDALRGMSTEHATGIAAILTELCRVWWSEEFDLSESP